MRQISYNPTTDKKSVYVSAIAFSADNLSVSEEPSRVAIGGDCSTLKIHQLDLKPDLVKLWIQSPTPPSERKWSRGS